MMKKNLNVDAMILDLRNGKWIFLTAMSRSSWTA